MNMKLDYSKTINEQMNTFSYYQNRYASYVLAILKLQQENQNYRKIFDKLYETIIELSDNTDDTTCYDIDRNCKDNLLDILKEVE